MAFAVPAIGLLLWQLWRTVSNRLRDDELLMVQELEDLARCSRTARDGPP
jgi:hypothetical protein